MKKAAISSSTEALFRYMAVSKVWMRCEQGMSRNAAIEEVSGEEHLAFDGKGRRISRRTLYRWVDGFETAKAAESDVLQALERKARTKTQSSVVLKQNLLAYLKEEKEADPGASVPELINRAREQGLVDAGAPISRSTVSRSLKRMGVSLVRRKGAESRDCRRYSFAHRMECVLCDGKHFRAGEKRVKRVALFYLDDATRFALHVVVGTSESKELFLRGLYEMVQRYGTMSVLYLDNGSGFIAGDTTVAAKNLGAALVHGERAYPEGHGKIEVFNRGAKAKVLRGYDGRIDLDSTLEGLEFRLAHFIREVYNHTPHESLGRRTPSECFLGDSKPLRMHSNDEDLRDCFITSIKRVVSKDNIISFDGQAYEMPTGYACQTVGLIRKFLEKTIHFNHGGRFIQLHHVDPIANSRSRRTHPKITPEEPQPNPRKSATDMAYERAYQPLTGPDGGYKD